MRRAILSVGLVLLLAGCSGTSAQDAGTDVAPIDAVFVGPSQLPQGGVPCTSDVCNVSVYVSAGTPRGYAIDVNGTAMIGTDVAVIHCSLTGDTNRLVLTAMMGSCDVLVSTHVTWNATASYALQTAIDGGVCTTPELSMTITAMDGSTHEDLRFGLCP